MADEYKGPIATFISEEFMGGATVDPSTSLFQSQTLDSIALASLVAFLEDEWSIRVNTLEIVIENFDTVDATAAFVARKLADG